MATEIKVPTLGESVSEATVARWLKQEGETVAVDEPLLELETDKVTLEVNASAAGTLEEIVVPEGENVEVGALLGRIGDGAGAAKATAKPAAEPAPAKAEAPSGDASEGDKKPAPEKTPGKTPAAEKPKGEGGGETVEITVPSLGESVSEATVAKWLKQEGDSVAADEPLVELETDKVTLEVNAAAAGVLREIAVPDGESVEVGARLGAIAAGAAPAQAPAERAAPPAAPTSAPAGDGQEAGTEEGGPDALDPRRAPRSGEDGTITAADLEAFVAQGTPSAAMTLSPAVAKLVAEHDLDPARLQGTGPHGRITKEDVLAVIEGRAQPLAKPRVEAGAAPGPSAKAPPEPAAKAPATGAREERVRMSRLRQTVARRLKEAQNTAAMLTTFNEVDMTAVMDLRARYRDDFEKKHGVRLGVMGFFAKAAVKALKEVPAVNARIDGEELVYNKFFDVGMAVSTPNGLMVPVIRDCDAKSFAEIEKALGDLAKRARDGKLALEEMQGGSFTITNGGVFGSLLSTPILNYPQSGILGMHKIQQRPMVLDDGRIEARPMMYLALSYDHRIVDGREAVTFLVRIKEAIEDPERLLLDL